MNRNGLPNIVSKFGVYENMLYQTGLGNGAVGQHKIIVRADSKGGDGMGVVTRLNLVHHDEWFALRYQLLNFISFQHYAGMFCSM